jgi:hypothetical protein
MYRAVTVFVRVVCMFIFMCRCLSRFDIITVIIVSTGWTLGVLGFDSRLRLGIFLFTTASRTALGPTQAPIQWVPWALSLGVKRPEREADHSPPFSATVKNAWSYTSTSQYFFMARCLVKHRDNFTFTFTLSLVLLLILCTKVYIYARPVSPSIVQQIMSTFYTYMSLDI